MLIITLPALTSISAFLGPTCEAQAIAEAATKNSFEHLQKVEQESGGETLGRSSPSFEPAQAINGEITSVRNCTSSFYGKTSKRCGVWAIRSSQDLTRLVKGIVLSFDPHLEIANLLVETYNQLWPDCRFQFRIPFTDRDPRAIFRAQNVEFISTPPDIPQHGEKSVVRSARTRVCVLVHRRSLSDRDLRAGGASRSSRLCF